MHVSGPYEARPAKLYERVALARAPNTPQIAVTCCDVLLQLFSGMLAKLSVPAAMPMIQTKAGDPLPGCCTVLMLCVCLRMTIPSLPPLPPCLHRGAQKGSVQVPRAPRQEVGQEAADQG